MSKDLKQSVESYLGKMRNVKNATDKGELGEMAVLSLCETIYQKAGGLIYHSYTYKTDRDLPGNIKIENGRPYLEGLSSTTECDIVLVTPFKVFPIEVKAYKASKIVLNDEGIEGSAFTNKSPIHQHEMHCRHLYSHLFTVLPDGQSKYIVPIVVFADCAKITDNRSDAQRNYIHFCILNTTKSTISKYDVHDLFKLDLPAIDRVLRDASVSYKKYYPLRVV